MKKAEEQIIQKKRVIKCTDNDNENETKRKQLTERREEKKKRMFNSKRCELQAM